MTQKPGRNDPCPCGSEKKYKNCCLKNEVSKSKPMTLAGKRKFTATIISSGNQAQKKEVEQNQIPAVDYNTLMERSFGNALQAAGESELKISDPANFMKSEGK